MEQHPIPQQISSYQFRLVGDMTLKQFFEIAGGIVVALMFYASPLLGIIKWPFVIISALLGVGLAFFPLEERPLEKWIFAFFGAIYSPTIYSWEKNSQPNMFFQNEPAGEKIKEVSQGPNNGANPQKIPLLEMFESAESNFLSRLSGLFSTGFPANSQGSPVAQQAQPAPQPQEQPLAPQRQGIIIPQPQPVKVGVNIKPGLIVEEQKTQDPKVQFAKVTPTIAGGQFVTTKAVQFSPESAPPNPPTTPNVIVGQVLDTAGAILESAIMEIKDTAGRPVRALKSNRLGHFIIVTPLESGRYEIVTEKEGYEFSPVSFEATGVIIPPILIEGKKIAN